MKRWVRWQFIVPRLLLCVVAVIGVHVAAGLAVRSMAARYGARIFGVRMNVAKARVSWSNGRVLLEQLNVVDTDDASKTWCTAASCEAVLAGRPLLAKQVIVTKARMSGIRFEDAAATRETAIHDDAAASRWFHDHAVEAARDRLANLAARSDEKLLDQLESVRRINEFRGRWPTEVAALRKRAEALEVSTKALEKSVTAASDNPLRNSPMLDDVSAKADQLRTDVESTRQDFENLAGRLEDQRRAIVAARRRDDEFLRGKLHFEAVDSKLLNAYLLREEAARQLDSLLGWLRRLREMAPADPGGSHAARNRGQNVLFAGMRPRPGFLIRELELRGEARIAGRPVEFCGLASNLTSTPASLGEPTRLQLSAKDGVPFELRATIDRTNGNTRDELFVECRELPMNGRRLGQAGQLQLQVAPSSGSLIMSLNTDGSKLTGDIQLVQRKARMTPAFACHGITLPLGESMDQSLGKFDSVATRISLHGTIDEPTCTLWSNLGPAVAEALRHGLERHAETQVRVVLEDARRHVDERLAELDRQMADERGRFANRVAKMFQRLETIAQAQTPRERISIEQAGRRLPATSILR